MSFVYYNENTLILCRSVARLKTVGWTEGASRTHGERGARAYYGGLVPEAESILPLDHPNEGQNLPL